MKFLGPTSFDGSHHDAADLYAEIEHNEDTIVGEYKKGRDDGEVADKTFNNKGWVDEINQMTVAEHRKLQESILPLKLALMKIGDIVADILAAHLHLKDLQTHL